ncbi:MAG TPA: methionine gamma-lyase family protein [Clostridia bacterium]|nr:methionine gamma-lyase family protein [Clostridia bacterium]
MRQQFFKIDDKIMACSEKAIQKTKEPFKRIESISEYNQLKVLSAFIENGVSESHFVETTGYGYGDRGRDVLDRVCAQAFGAEDALVRHSFASGTHTIAVALYGLLRPNDTMLCVTGTPYDTIQPVIGIKGEGQGSLKDFGVNYKEVALNSEGKPDHDAILDALTDDVRMVYLQRSRGYTLRPSFSAQEIGEVARLVKANSKAIVVVDNCYGEFVQTKEPTDFGADIIIGSLTKNPGGGIAKTGGYIAGKANLIELCSYRLTTPGLGRDVGASLGQNRSLFMGLFHAPHVTGEAVKAAVFAAALFEEFGFKVAPESQEERYDIVQSFFLQKPEALIAFCQGMQCGAPIDSFVTPEPWDMPGYENKVIMAAGAFTMGASIELSADAPLKPPYVAWMQGGLNFHSAKMGILLAAQAMLEKGQL